MLFQRLPLALLGQFQRLFFFEYPLRLSLLHSLLFGFFSRFPLLLALDFSLTLVGFGLLHTLKLGIDFSAIEDGRLDDVSLFYRVGRIR